MKRSRLAVAFMISLAVSVSSAVAIFEFGFAVPGATANSLSAKIPLFQFERQAQLHCPGDAIVWATAGTGIYDSSADRWYGRTSTGAYGCLHEAKLAGYRADRSER